MNPFRFFFTLVCFVILPGRNTSGQSADWQEVVWREPQVRYLLADMTLGGNTKLYRDYATTERDPIRVKPFDGGMEARGW